MGDCLIGGSDGNGHAHRRAGWRLEEAGNQGRGSVMEGGWSSRIALTDGLPYWHRPNQPR